MSSIGTMIKLSWTPTDPGTLLRLWLMASNLDKLRWTERKPRGSEYPHPWASGNPTLFLLHDAQLPFLESCQLARTQAGPDVFVLAILVGPEDHDDLDFTGFPPFLGGAFQAFLFAHEVDFEFLRRVEGLVTDRADQFAVAVQIDKDPVLGGIVERRRRAGKRQVDGVVELIDAHEVDRDHEEHDQLEDEVQ